MTQLHKFQCYLCSYIMNIVIYYFRMLCIIIKNNNPVLGKEKDIIHLHISKIYA